MKYTRRDFIKFGSFAGLVAGTIPAFAKSALGQDLFSDSLKTISDPFFFQNAATFQTLVGSEFIVYSDDSTVSAVLSKVEISDSVRKNSGECFSLSFEMPSDNFAQNTYRMFHPTIGYFELLSVPGLRDNGRSALTAIINRI